MDWDIFFDIHKDLPRQGSGRDEYTQKAFEMIPPLQQPHILDIGCGPGLQTIKLAKLTSGSIIAIDIHQPYLDQLQQHIKKENLTDRITPRNLSMFTMDFPEESFDIIWAEGSIFIVGFEQGLKQWKKYIKKNGYLAVHEMTWLKDNPPQEIKQYWNQVYPAISTIEKNLEIIKQCGYRIVGYFPLSEDAWWEFYYDPLEKRLQTLRSKYKNNPEALEMIKEEQKEIDLYRKHNHWYGSVFYIMQKPST
ncbi:MAG: methyltransferase domain-containing protein [Candidatus Thermoplasmatota archaeon]|nr:methyltransferase domain-containing protein [Candidatus Thermoplasmatota archaeon]MBU1941405.1 methyltransferase domain-containing protein [Candidatus Thermoplasmatota archaeon]